MDVFLKIIPYIVSFITVLFGGFYLGGWKAKKSSNNKNVVNDRVDLIEELVGKVEELSAKSVNNHERKEEYRSEILKMLRLWEVHFETCKNPIDDFSKYVEALNLKHRKKS